MERTICFEIQYYKSSPVITIYPVCIINIGFIESFVSCFKTRFQSTTSCCWNYGLITFFFQLKMTPSVLVSFHDFSINIEAILNYNSEVDANNFSISISIHLCKYNTLCLSSRYFKIMVQRILLEEKIFMLYGLVPSVMNMSLY